MFEVGLLTTLPGSFEAPAADDADVSPEDVARAAAIREGGERLPGKKLTAMFILHAKFAGRDLIEMYQRRWQARAMMSVKLRLLLSGARARRAVVASER